MPLPKVHQLNRFAENPKLQRELEQLYFLVDKLNIWTNGIITIDEDGNISTTGTLNADGAVTLGAAGGSADTQVLGDLDVDENLNIDGNVVIDGTITAPTWDWTGWTPTVTASGSMTISSTTISIARYCQIGKTVFFQIFAAFTTGGTAAKAVQFTLPVQAANTLTNRVTVGCATNPDGSVLESGFARSAGTGTLMECFTYDNRNWTLGANRQIGVSGSYEVA